MITDDEEMAEVADAEARYMLAWGESAALRSELAAVKEECVRLKEQVKFLSEASNASKAALHKCEAECESLEQELEGCKIARAQAEARLDSERKATAKHDVVVREFMVKMQEFLTFEEGEEKVESANTWQFDIQRDGAMQMVGVTARAKV